MSDNKLYVGEVAVDASKAKQEFENLGKNFGKVIDDMEKKGQQSDPLGPTSEKTEKSSEKMQNSLKRSEKAMVNLIQRTTAELNTLGKGQSAYLAEISKIKGVDPAIIEPYLAKLREAEKAQAAATAGLGNMGISAKATAAALRQVPAQFTDIVVSLQGGQAPMTVLLQQGGQLRDVFGSAGAAARAMAGYVAGLISPLTVVAAAAAVLAVAYKQGSAESDRYRNALILTGNAAGASVGALQSMAASVSSISGSTKGAASEALIEFAKNADVATGKFVRFSALAVDANKLTGASITDTVKAFSSLGDKPLEASTKLNETTRFLTLAVYDQIKALEEQGKTSEAASVAQNAYADVLDRRLKEIKSNMGIVESAWEGVKGAAKGAWDAMLDVGRQTTPEEQLDKINKRLRNAGALGAAARNRGQNVPEGSTNSADIDNLREIVKLRDRAARAAADEAQIVQERIKWDKDGVQFKQNDQKLQEEINKAVAEGTRLKAAGALNEAQYAQRMIDIVEKYKDKSKTPAGPTAFATQMAELEKQIQLSNKELESGQKLLDFQKFEVAETVKASEALKNKKMTADEYAKVIEKTKAAVEAMVKAENNTQINKARADYAKDQQDAQIEISKANEASAASYAKVSVAASEYSRSLTEQLAVQRLEVSTYGQMAPQREIAIAQLKNQYEYEKRLRDLSEQTMGATERDRIKAQYRADLEKKNAAAVEAAWAKAAMGISDALTNAFMDAAANGKNIFEALGRAIEKEFASMVLRPIVQGVVQGAAGAVGSAAGSFGMSLAGSAVGKAVGIESVLASGELQLSTSTMETLAAFSEAVPYVAAAVIAYNLLSNQGGGPATQNLGDVRRTYNNKTWTVSEESQVFISKQADDTVRSMAESYFSKARTLGVNARNATFGFGSNNIDGGKVIVSSQVGDSMAYGSGEVSPQALKTVAARAVFAALKDSELPQYIRNIFDKVDTSTATEEVIGAALEYAAALKTVRESMGTVGEYTTTLRTRVDQGLADLNTSAKSFKTDFVRAIDAGLSPEQLQKWQSLGADMNQLAEYTGDYTLAVRSQIDVMKERKTLQDQLDDLTLTSAQLLQKQRDAVDDSNKSLFDQVQAQKALKKANEDNTAWIEKYAVLTNQTTQLQIDRQKALANVTNIVTIGLIDAYYRQLDMIDAADAAYSALEASVSKQKESANLTKSLAQEQINTLKSIFATLKTNIDELYAQTNAQASAASGMSFIDQALATAKTSGYMPDQQALADAISSARTGLDPNNFSTKAEADLARLSLASKLKELKDVSGNQLTAAEQQLKTAEDQLTALEDLLKTSQDQLAEAKGTKVEIVSLADAIKVFAKSVDALVKEKALATLGSTTTGTTTVGNNSGRDFTMVGGSSTLSYNSSAKIYDTIQGLSWQEADKANSAKALYQVAMEVGATQADIARISGYSLESILALFDKANIPRFAVGTNYVPQDMVAMLHKGEAVVPSVYNPANGGSSSDGQLIQSLISEIQLLRAESRSAAASAEQTAKILYRVTRGGDGMMISSDAEIPVTVFM